MIKLHKDGEMHARDLIEHGKVNDGPFSFDGADKDALLGPKGTHVEHFARHHLGKDEAGDDGDPKSYRYPFAKDGAVHSRALESIRGRAEDNGHDEVRASAEGLIAMIDDANRSSSPAAESRRIVREGGKYYVKSEDGSKNLGGPYDTEEEAKKRLAEVDYFKAKDAKSLIVGAEMRCLMSGLQLRNLDSGSGSPGTIVGYAAVFDRFSQDLGSFRERIAPGAFRDCLARCDVRAMANHDPNRLLARNANGTLRLREDELGLRTEIDLPPTQVGRDTATEVRTGLMDGMSFSFDTESDEWDYSGKVPIRTLVKVRNLYDVGPVTFPAYTDTSAAMRSMEMARRPAPKPSPRHHLSHAKARLRLAEAYFQDQRP